jgi:uncharacterized membrane protein YidH (DUF202 family)
MQSDEPQSSTLVNWGGDHPRLTPEGRQLIGSVVFLLLLAAVAVGFWKFIQSERKKRKRPTRKSRRVNLMDVIATENPSDGPRHNQDDQEH